MRRLSTIPRLVIIVSLLSLLLVSMVVLTPTASATLAQETVAGADGSDSGDGSGDVSDNEAAAVVGTDLLGQLSREPTYTATPLPTVQIDDVVWGQLVIDDAVYVVGNLNSAHPAGTRAGQQEVPLSNILAYDLNTGKLIEDFAPTLNGAGRSLTPSEGGKTLYVIGEFDRVNNEWHNHLAAFDTSHGRDTLISSFKPVFSAIVKDIAVVGDTLYVGGYFTKVNNQQWIRLAALKASTGEFLGWITPVEGPNIQIYVIEVFPDHSKVVIGGSFSMVNGSSKSGYGMALLSASTGEVLSVPVNDMVRTVGEKAAISDTAVDENGFYGTAYSAVGRLGEINLEGSFKADRNGNLVWFEPCHGDTYGIAPTKDTVYTVGHARSCETIYGFPNMPEVRKDGQYPLYVRAMAFTNSSDIIICHQGAVSGYQDWPTSGLKSPMIIGWYPGLEAGKFTKTSQTAFKVDATDSYILMVGEFIEADSKAQQGTVRCPERVGQFTLPPEGKAEILATKAEVTTPSSVRMGFNATWNRDDPTLIYSLYRDDETTSVATEKISDTRWALRGHSLEDTTYSPGDHTYRLVVFDPGGNTITTQTPDLTVSKTVQNNKKKGKKAKPAAEAKGVANNADQDGNQQAADRDQATDEEEDN